MRSLRMALLALALALAVPGCTYGILYTHTFEPLTPNMHSTPAGQSETISDIKHVQVSWLGVMWGNDGLGEIAREHGIKELYFADLEHLSVLTVWQQYTVHLYGR